jgi:hypothetical protein
MRTWRDRAAQVAAFASCVLLLAGCGSASEEPPSGGQKSSEVPEAANVGPCPADSPAIAKARALVRADLDGDGRAEAVRLTADDTECPRLVFAEVGQRYLATRLPKAGPEAVRAFAVELPGHEGDVVVTRQGHPRGGFQLRLFVAGTDDLVELKDGSGPLVPFVALDVDEHPFSVDCTDGGVELVEAVAHEPPGIIFTWDIRRTTYAVTGTEVARKTSREIADNVLPGHLPSRYPALVEHRAFESCRAGR